ncbi:uncharacterized protein YebE (UPF0316 family) [Orenia metallireducens]|jgi:uncharacterized protein YebE (UPF0316 family)|uniref:Uncharacterized protein YebE, UPF0316 family n=1 Tax=Orenia metallireducens TaxID=1413210 RepID=A0A285GWF6_9FIRM|nr:DUF5698 domain-containing protein [Orenia metallireducens]PRX31060.1 uncharacterized protein YebE (UPF0316 family) [Orenia metallireducens]SNY27842.1 Uncharacterized protein YebE, UPF0316 family [Orenia metallireducens]
MVKVILWALLIFISRAIDVALGTLRVRMVVNKRRYLAATIGFFEVLIYILIVSKVLQDTSNIFNVIAYCAGFSCGTILGLNLEDHLSLNLLQATVMIEDNPCFLLKLIREAEFKADLLVRAEGVDNEIDVINVILAEERREELEEIIKSCENDPLVSFQSLSQSRNDYFYSLKNKI